MKTNRKPRPYWWAAASALLALSGCRSLPEPQRNLPVRMLYAQDAAARVQVAATAPSREKGLMFRRSLPENEGMLLVFDEADYHCLWMADTPLPLSAAFVRADGVVAQLADMAPLSRDIHCAREPVRYAWEMPQGWFAARGIGQGSRVGNLPAPPGF